MAKELTFQNVRCVGQAGHGAFRLDEKRLGWKCVSGTATRPREWTGSDLTKAQWQPSGGGCGLLKLHFGNDSVRFADLDQGALPKIKDHLKQCFKVQLAELKPSTAGWSWGELELVDDKSLCLMAGNVNDRAVALEVEIPELNQVASVGKQELVLELHSRPDELLQSIRFIVPSGEEGESAESWRDELLRLAKTTDGQVLAQIQNVTIVAPRGKHDLHFLSKGLQLRGKSQSYALKWESIKKLFLVDMPSNQKLVVIGVTPPIQCGRILHRLLGFTFDSQNESVVAEEAVPQAAWDAARSQGGFDKNRDSVIQAGEDEAPKWEVVIQLIKELSGTKTVQPMAFEGSDGQKGVACTFVTDRGFLFFYQKQFLFVKKPITWRLWAEVIGVQFRDTPMRKSSFDLKFLFRDDGKPMEFTQIDKRDQKKIFELLEKIPDVKDKIRDADEVRRGFNKPQATQDRAFRRVGASAQATVMEDEDDDFNDDDSDASADGDNDEDDDTLPAPKRLRSTRD